MDGNDHVIPMMIHEGHDDEHVDRYTDIRMTKNTLTIENVLGPSPRTISRNKIQNQPFGPRFRG